MSEDNSERTKSNMTDKDWDRLGKEVQGWEDKVKANVKNRNAFSGIFKFAIGEKVRSRIHEANGIIEYSEMTRYIGGDQISYKIRFNDEEDLKTETSMVDEPWLEKI